MIRRDWWNFGECELVKGLMLYGVTETCTTRKTEHLTRDKKLRVEFMIDETL